MKKFSIIMMCVACLAFTSCKSLSGGGSSSSDSAAKATGRNTATALVGLYNSYRANGTISLSNTADLTNALVVATGYTSLRSNQNNPSYKTSFASGMVSASTSLITTANVNSIINTMNSLTGLNVNAATISNNVNTVTALLTLIQALGTASN